MPMAAPRWGAWTSSATRRRRSTALPGVKSVPVAPSRTRSIAPPAPAATTGRPEAMASWMTWPKVSVSEGKTNMSALA